MNAPSDYSANEVQALVLKAARGGEIPLGHAEDLAGAVAFLDFEKVETCPCSGPDPVAVFGPIALDLVAAGEGPQVVQGDSAVIASLVAYFETQMGRKLVWSPLPDGARFERFEGGAVVHSVIGRREVNANLMAHLIEMASKIMVPESDESRASGAGAGLSDND